MEIRELAETILFGNSLSDKLNSPDHYTDDNPSHFLTLPEKPSRPSDVPWQTKQNKIIFPKHQEIETSMNSRAMVMHFLANHELLAIEIMALVLLKFPNAPSSFRNSIVETIKEEQTHFNLYLSYMEKHNLRFGDIPVNDFFWKTSKEMSSPLDFVAQISLTFEQANLDFACYYQELFSRFEDEHATEILTRVYEDEIGHVKNGLKWFKHWQPKNLSLWEAYKQQLQYPLTPQRAKFHIFDFEGRKKAGLDNEFIDQLNIYSHSKGKTPRIFYYNGDAEYYTHQNPDHKTKALLNKLKRDLSPLMIIFCSSSDTLVSETPISKELLQSLKSIDISLPEFLVLDEADKLIQRKIDKVSPWAIFNNMPSALLKINSLESNHSRYGEASFDSFKTLASKVNTHALESSFLSTYKSEDYTQPSSEVINTESTISTINLTPPFILKGEYGAAGNQNRSIHNTQELKHCENWIASTLTSQKILAETKLNKILDISFLYTKNEDGRFISKGYTLFFTTNTGQFCGTLLGNAYTLLNPQIQKALFTPSDPFKTKVYQLQSQLREFLQSEQNYESFKNHTGPIGVDAFLISEGNSIKYRPICEINPRYTMGFVANEWNKKISNSSFGVWCIQSKRQLKQLGFKNIADFHNLMKSEHPLEYNSKKLIEKGYFCCNDFVNCAEYIAFIWIQKEKELFKSSLKQLFFKIDFEFLS